MSGGRQLIFSSSMGMVLTLHNIILFGISNKNIYLKSRSLDNVDLMFNHCFNPSLTHRVSTEKICKCTPWKYCIFFLCNNFYNPARTSTDKCGAAFLSATTRLLSVNSGFTKHQPFKPNKNTFTSYTVLFPRMWGECLSLHMCTEVTCFQNRAELWVAFS